MRSLIWVCTVCQVLFWPDTLHLYHYIENIYMYYILPTTRVYPDPSVHLRSRIWVYTVYHHHLWTSSLYKHIHPSTTCCISHATGVDPDRSGLTRCPTWIYTGFGDRPDCLVYLLHPIVPARPTCALHVTAIPTCTTRVHPGRTVYRPSARHDG